MSKKDKYDRECREFWKKAWLASMASPLSRHYAAKDADGAVAEFMKRYPFIDDEMPKVTQ